MGLDLGSVVRSCMAELVRREELPWVPGQVTHVRLPVVAQVPDDCETVEVAVPVALLKKALKNQKAPDVEDAEGQK